MNVQLEQNEVSEKLGPVYRLGEISFLLDNCDSVYKERVSRVLPADWTGADRQRSHVVQTGCAKDVKEIIDHLARLHLTKLWLPGSCLKSPTGQFVVLLGTDDTEVAAIVAYMVTKKNYLSVSERNLVIDTETGLLTSFHAPLSLTDNTVQKLAELDISLEPLHRLEFLKKRSWHPLSSEQTADDGRLGSAKVFFVIDDCYSSNRLTSRVLSSAELLRHVMPISNALRLDGACEFFASTIGEPVLEISGGTLLERVDLVSQTAF